MPTIGRTALATVDLLIARGADFDAALRYTAGDPATGVDLTGWTARAELRSYVAGTVWTTWTSSDRIALAADGTITIHLPHTVTETPDWDNRSTGVWDLELTDPDGTRIRLVEGSVRISQDVTRG